MNHSRLKILFVLCFSVVFSLTCDMEYAADDDDAHDYGIISAVDSDKTAELDDDSIAIDNDSAFSDTGMLNDDTYYYDPLSDTYQMDAEFDVWIDDKTGLVWQVTPTGGEIEFSQADDHCERLFLGGYDDWRLPTISELRSLFSWCTETKTDGACNVSDDCLNSSCKNSSCDGCLLEDDFENENNFPLEQKESDIAYWSSNVVQDLRGFAWQIQNSTGEIGIINHESLNNVRCVRGFNDASKIAIHSKTDQERISKHNSPHSANRSLTSASATIFKTTQLLTNTTPTIETSFPSIASEQPDASDYNQYRIVATDPANDDYFGYSVSISGDYAIVGAYQEDTGGSEAGAAYIYQRTGNNIWDSAVKIQSTSPDQADQFGYSVSISGDYAIVGARLEDLDDVGEFAGAAYIFHRTGDNSWTDDPVANILPDEPSSYAYYGNSVSISGDYAIVGAYHEYEGGSRAGAAYIFHRTGTNTWDTGTRIVSSDPDADDYFGQSVSISGDYAIVGAYLEDTTGAAYIFHRTGTNTWGEVTRKISSDTPVAYDHFGYSVSISGDYAIVGADQEDGSGTDAGAVYIFHRTGTNTWDGGIKKTASDAQDSDYFGHSVSISGDYAIVGAYREDEEGSNAGAAYIFHRTGTNTWEEVEKNTATYAYQGDYYGCAAAISSDHSIVGAYGAYYNYGAAYISDLSNTESSVGTWREPNTNLIWQLEPPDTEKSWSDANSYCSTLPTGGLSWRLPTISELRSLVRDCANTQTGGACGVKDDCLDGSCNSSSCAGCQSDQGPADGCYWPTGLSGDCGTYWSSSEASDIQTWALMFTTAGVYAYQSNLAGQTFKVRCVSDDENFVEVPAGNFNMGSPVGETGRSSYETQHEVTLTNAFEIGAYEVTQDEYEALMGGNPSYFSADGAGADCGGNCPVENVSWFDALAYANKKSENKSYKPCYVLSGIKCQDNSDGDTANYCKLNDGIKSASVSLNSVGSVYWCEGYRLPTEAEWEKAARAGTTTAYYNGEDTDLNLINIAWYTLNAHSSTHPVGQKSPNDLGLYDTSGNVDEWVWDYWYNEDYSGNETDPEGALTGTQRANRGGRYDSPSSSCRSATRNSSNPNFQGSFKGFRIARTIDPPEYTEDFALIKAGTFTMGSPTDEPGRVVDDETQHEVTLTNDFEVSIYETTQSQFQTLLSWTPSHFGPNDDYPVEDVSWYDAIAYSIKFSQEKSINPCYTMTNIVCAQDDSAGNTTTWCNDKEGIKSATVALNGVSSVYDCVGYRLLTEAEWEYATRAGTTTAYYNGTNSDASHTQFDVPDIENIGWYGGNWNSTTHPVGEKYPNNWGLYDMSGNVWEWVWDWYDATYPGTVTDPEGPESDGGQGHVIRGGDAPHYGSNLRSANRYIDDGTGDAYIGIRLARTLETEAPTTTSTTSTTQAPTTTIVTTTSITTTTASPVWTDSETELTWQVAPTGGEMSWASAGTHCDGLTLNGLDWRLPSISELRSLILDCADTISGGDCDATDSCTQTTCKNTPPCYGCTYDAGPSDGCYWSSQFGSACSEYESTFWSSSAVDGAASSSAWTVNFRNGEISYDTTSAYTERNARCVSGDMATTTTIVTTTTTTTTTTCPGCYIEETCYNDGDANPSNECQYCDDSSPAAWSSYGSETSCAASNASVALCDGAGGCDAIVCNGGYTLCLDACVMDPVPDGGQCLIDCVSYNDGDANPSNECQYCDDSSPAAWSSYGSETSCAASNASVALCDGAGGCDAIVCNGGYTLCLDACVMDPVPDGGQCLIDCVSYNDGDANPSNECQYCDDSSPAAWSSYGSETSCAASNASVALCDGAGGCDAIVCNGGYTLCLDACVMDPVPDGGQCLIDCVSYNDGDANPSNECQYCDDSSPAAWSSYGSETSCTASDPNAYTAACDGSGSCDVTSCMGGYTLCSGSCLMTPVPDGGQCLIDCVSYNDGDANPSNECEFCNDAYPTSWSDNDGASCDDGVFCNGDDTCLSGACDTHAGNPCSGDTPYCWCDAPATNCQCHSDAAVDLIEFAAERKSDGVLLTWLTGSEMQCGAFGILRCRISEQESSIEPQCALDDHTPLDMTIPCENEPSGARYESFDAGASADAAWSYYLREYETGGGIVDYGPLVLPAGEESAGIAKADIKRSAESRDDLPGDDDADDDDNVNPDADDDIGSDGGGGDDDDDGGCGC